jgi:hypothetical protein
MREPWPFDQPPNCAVISLRSIMQGSDAVLHVSHDADDHGWQFLSGGPVEMANAVLVTLSSIVERDPSLYEVADLPPGWHAWRKAVGASWSRQASTEGEA